MGSMLPYIPYMDPMGKLDNFDSHLFIVVDHDQQSLPITPQDGI